MCMLVQVKHMADPENNSSFASMLFPGRTYNNSRVVYYFVCFTMKDVLRETQKKCCEEQLLCR